MLHTVPRTKWNPIGFCLRHTVCRRFFYVLCALAILSLGIVVHIPSRNAVLRGAWPRHWADLSTWQVVKMRAAIGNIDVGSCADVKCSAGLYKPKTRRQDVERRHVEFYDSDIFTSKAAELESWMWKFLPVMDRQEKITLLHTLDVLAEVMAHAGLKFFMVHGTLLGAVRNQGIVPWDDDIDLAVNGSEWRQVRQALCCVQGFKLITKDFMHWKFFSTDGPVIRQWPMFRFPFVDLFFYTEDSQLIWALTPYILQDLVFKKTDVFPLGQIKLDGQLYPAPRTADALVRSLWDLSTCVSPNMLHKVNVGIPASDRKVVQCSSLRRMYPSMAGEGSGGGS